MELTVLLEAMFRGGGAAISVVLIVQLLALRPVSLAAIYGAAFLAGAAIYGVIALPVINEVLGSWIIPFKTIGMMAPGFFWLFIQALHDDEYRFRWPDAVPVVIIAAIYLSCVPFPDARPFLTWVQLAIVVGLMAHSIYIVRHCIDDDLVASRRHFSRTMSWLVPLIAAAIIGIEVIEIAEIRNMTARLAVAVTLLTVAITLIVTMSTLRKTLMPVHASTVGFDTARTGVSAADRIDLGRLRDLMEEGAYLSAGLTIGELAQSLAIPEHRLRKLINGALGYRNFAAFINDYRIAEAERRLAEPDMARAQITNLAFDIGFASLAPFNRAFRSRTGMSPSQYREKALTEH